MVNFLTIFNGNVLTAKEATKSRKMVSRSGSARGREGREGKRKRMRVEESQNMVWGVSRRA